MLSADASEFVPGRQVFGQGVFHSNGYMPAEMEHGYDSGEAKEGSQVGYSDFVDLETFLTPQPMELEETDTGTLRIEGRRLHWDVPGEWEEL